MSDAARRVAPAALVLIVAACGGAAFTAGGGQGDGGTIPVDATAESSVDSGTVTAEGGGSGSSSGAGSSGGSGGSSSSSSSGSSSSSSSGGTNTSGCDAGSACTSGYCKAGVCTPCTSDAQCDASQFCDIGAGICRSTLGNGQTCTRPAQCASTFCADGVCCSTACSGTCEACNEPGATGTCTPVPQGTNNPMRSCPSPDVCCPGGAEGSVCTNTGTSVDNCGSCGHVCTTSLDPECASPACVSDSCVISFNAAGTHCGDGGTCNGTGVCL